MKILRRKSLDDVVVDDAFWLEQGRAMSLAVRPIFKAAFLAGAAAAERTRARKDFDVDEFSRIADQAIVSYTNDWWQRIEETTRRALREAVIMSRDKQWTLAQLRDFISPLFGPDRAMTIAITETTTLMGVGAQAQYRYLGYPKWEWQTARDDRVCPICGPRQGVEFDINHRFEAAHPRCRCWPLPAGELPPVL